MNITVIHALGTNWVCAWCNEKIDTNVSTWCNVDSAVDRALSKSNVATVNSTAYARCNSPEADVVRVHSS